MGCFCQQLPCDRIREFDVQMLQEIVVQSRHFYIRWHHLSMRGGEFSEVLEGPVDLRWEFWGSNSSLMLRLKRVIEQQQYTHIMEFAEV